MTASPRIEGIPEIPDKHVFKIGEVGRLVGVKTHVLRFWETEFTSVRPRKGRNGHRQYSREDVERLCRIRLLLHDRGMTIAGARALLKEGPEAVDAVLVGGPAEAVDALRASQAEQQALADQLAQAHARLSGLERDLRRAEEEARFWRTAAQTAEGRLDALKAQVNDEADRLEALFSAND